MFWASFSFGQTEEGGSWLRDCRRSLSKKPCCLILGSLCAVAFVSLLVAVLSWSIAPGMKQTRHLKRTSSHTISSNVMAEWGWSFQKKLEVLYELFSPHRSPRPSPGPEMQEKERCFKSLLRDVPAAPKGGWGWGKSCQNASNQKISTTTGQCSFTFCPSLSFMC